MHQAKAGRLRPLTLLAGVVLCVAAAHAAARAADWAPSLTVIAASGGAEVERLGERHRLQAGEILDERDVLHLDVEGHLALRLVPGGVLELGPQAELSVEKLPGAARNDRKSIFSLMRGYLRIAWAPPANPSAPFYLYFSGQRASLGAGEYFFEAEPDTARLCVASGQLIAIPIAGSNPQTLVPAACYRLSNGAEPERIARDAPAWASMRRNFSLNAPTSPEAELAASDPSARAAAGAPAAPVASPAPAAERAAATPPTAARSTPPEPSRAAPIPAPGAPPAVSVPSGSWAINIASYADPASADKQARELLAGGYQASVQPLQINGRQWYRVQVRGFDSSAAAQAQMQALKTKSGYANVWVVRTP